MVVVGVGDEDGSVSVVVLEPITRTGWMPEDCRMTGVVEAPEPRMRGVLSSRVEPAMR